MDIKEIDKFGPGIIGIASDHIGRYREFDQSVSNIVAPEGSKVEWYMGVDVAHNYNCAIRSMVDGDYSWVWLLDDDHIFPNTLLPSLLSRGKDIVIPLCMKRTRPFTPTVCEYDEGGKLVPKIRDFVIDDGLFHVSEDYMCGGAGMLIRRLVAKTMVDPWIRVGLFAPDKGSPDYSFIAAARGAGFKVYVDFDNPMGHLTHMAIWPQKIGCKVTPEFRGTNLTTMGG